MLNKSRFFFTGLLLSLLLVLHSTPVSSQQVVTVPNEVRRAQAAIYKIKIGGHSFCTGFAVDTGQQKLLISAGHCSEATKLGLPIVAYNSDTGKNSVIKLIQFEDHWPDRDYSVWNFLGGDPVYGLTLTDQIPQVGDEVYGIVAPKKWPHS